MDAGDGSFEVRQNWNIDENTITEQNSVDIASPQADHW